MDKCDRDTQQYNERLAQAVADAVVGQLVPAVRGMAQAATETVRVFTATFGPLAEAIKRANQKERSLIMSEASNTPERKHVNERPSRRSDDPVKRILGDALKKYINESSDTFDPVFAAEIREARPGWFENRSNRSPGRKEALLALAKSGGNRPSGTSKDPLERSLGVALTKYVCKYSRTYDPVFDSEIRKLRPDWFDGIVRTRDGLASKKAILLSMAREGLTRPSSSAKDPTEKSLGIILCCCTRKKFWRYDAVFDEEVRRLRPDWFKSRPDSMGSTHGKPRESK